MSRQSETPDLLLVEDNPDDAEMTLRGLKESVHADRLVHVDDGMKALDLLFGEGGLTEVPSSRLPRVVFLDLKLPKVDGLEVLRRIRSDSRTRTLPVVVFTSSKEERDIDEAYAIGANSYLVKPVDFDAYLGLVRDASRYWNVLNQPVCSTRPQ